jgi:hypothetical protein
VVHGKDRTQYPRTGLSRVRAVIGIAEPRYEITNACGCFFWKPVASW